jgi:hypothetical protein
MTVEPFWISVCGSELRQGDLLPNSLVPVLHPGWDEAKQAYPVAIHEYDLIILTQSCDLESNRSRLVALSPIFGVRDFEDVNENFKRKGVWENVRKGRVEGLHLLASPIAPEDNQQALVVDFREVYSLPFENLTRHAASIGSRWRLRSPYLEHFSQSFARFFMRVGLSSSIPHYH